MAKGAAYVRSFLDIPLAKEISSLIGGERTNRRIMGGGFESIRSFVPSIELSYKAISAAAKKSGTKNFLEIAAGFSTRGLEFSRERDLVYVECDLPKIIKAKKKVYDTLFKKKIDNLHFEEADALDQTQLLNATRFFKKGPVTVISEGLLVYFDNNQKKILARNIHNILTRSGGVWITSDFPVRKRIQFESGRDKNVLSRFKSISNKTNIHKNYFKDEEELLSFFHANGFNSKFFKIDILKEIRSASLSGLSSKEIRSILRDKKILILTPIKLK